MFTSWPTASVTRRQTAAPALSPFSAASADRIALSASAWSPYRLSIRLATRHISISGITLAGYPAKLYVRLMRQSGDLLPVTICRLLSAPLAVSAVRSPVVVHNAWAVAVKADEPGLA